MSASRVDLCVTAPEPIRQARRLATAVVALVREYELEIRAADSAERDLATARTLLLRVLPLLEASPERELLATVRDYLGDDSDAWEQA